jgi:hypothetical protein
MDGSRKILLMLLVFFTDSKLVGYIVSLPNRYISGMPQRRAGVTTGFFYATRNPAGVKWKYWIL